jgi:hypothetical protein
VRGVRRLGHTLDFMRLVLLYQFGEDVKSMDARRRRSWWLGRSARACGLFLIIVEHDVSITES